MTIEAKLLQHSVSPSGKEIATFELEYPRLFHSELMTHRVFSRNAASSRAIPIKKQLWQVLTNIAMPIHWGANQSGMQADAQLHGWKLFTAKSLWRVASWFAVFFAWLMYLVGLHKQVGNRILEPFTHIKVVLTSTEWDNFFELRCHKDAQPEFQELARKMRGCMDRSTPMELKEGEWHVPYVDRYRQIDGTLEYTTLDGKHIDEATARMISASASAQVSYRLLDTSVDKAKMIYKRLIGSHPIHASPFEHQATPMPNADDGSGNFFGWVQNRQILAEEGANETL